MDPQNQIKLIKSLFEDYGRIWISKLNKRGVRQIECALNNSFSFLLERGDKIDKWILNNKNCFFSFLAGFTDAEGCISVSNKNNNRVSAAYYSLGNYNKKLLEQIKDYLLKYGISSMELYESKIKGRICFDKYAHNQNYWSLRISKKDQLMKLLKILKIRSKHKDKKEAIEKAIGNIKRRNILYG